MAGIPGVHPETSEAFVPQMANLEIVGGVNFKKGCYPGQEIVARMQYLGKLKQRMYRARFEGDALPRPGDSIFAPDFPGQSAGTVVAAQPAPDNGFDLLGRDPDQQRRDRRTPSRERNRPETLIANFAVFRHSRHPRGINIPFFSSLRWPN